MPVQLVAQHVEWNLLYEDFAEHAPKELKFHLKHILSKIEQFYKNNEVTDTKRPKLDMKWIENDLVTTEACLDRTWEMLNSGYWKDVPIGYRYCYSLCSIIKSMQLEILTITEDHTKSIATYKEIIQQIDKGILLGAPLPRNKNLLTKIASDLNKHFSSMNESNKNIGTIKINTEELCTTLFHGFSPIANYTKPSMETFYCKIFQPKIPALLEGCLEHWRALHLWQDVEYLRKIVGNRTIPIEIGSRYTEDDWTQSLVTFSDFLKAHISSKSNKVGYLAQHQLFDQVPELKNDFSVPDYCTFSDNEEDNEELPDINAWFGPSGTVSPLHYDPKNNLLCQVFGCKRIVLYSPDDSEKVYPYETRLLNNTARIDPYNPNFEKYPKFKNAKGFMCYLKPGDMLFIPPKWWHHVVGLTPSFSISFWWD